MCLFSGGREILWAVCDFARGLKASSGCGWRGNNPVFNFYDTVCGEDTGVDHLRGGERGGGKKEYMSPWDVCGRKVVVGYHLVVHHHRIVTPGRRGV